MCCAATWTALQQAQGLEAGHRIAVLRRTWQAVERLLNTDAVLLGRRLMTCGAHAAAEELCARRQMPADFVVEVTQTCIHHLPCSVQQEWLASSECRCSCAIQSMVQTAREKHCYLSQMWVQAHVGSFRAMLSDTEGINKLIDVIKYAPPALPFCKPWATHLMSRACACWIGVVGRRSCTVQAARDFTE